MLYIVFHLSQSWFCSCTWYLLAAGVLFGYHLIIVSGIWCWYSWASVGFVLAPDISLWLGYCFDIMSLVSDAYTVEPELVLCSCLISPCSWGIVLISSYYCLWYLMPISMFTYHHFNLLFFKLFFIGTTCTLLSVI